MLDKHKRDEQTTQPASQEAACGPMERVCPICHCPVANPYALTCPRCRAELPAMHDCTTCGHACHRHN